MGLCLYIIYKYCTTYCIYLETGPHSVTQVDLIFIILLPPSPMCWEHRCVSPHLYPTIGRLDMAYNTRYSVSVMRTVLTLYCLGENDGKSSQLFSAHIFFNTSHVYLDGDPPHIKHWCHSCTHTHTRMYTHTTMSKFIKYNYVKIYQGTDFKGMQLPVCQ